MPLNARQTRRWVWPVLLLLVWLAAGGVLGPFAGKLGDVSSNDSAAFLPRSAESTRVAATQTAFAARRTLPLVIVWEGTERVTPAQTAAARRVLRGAVTVDGVAGRVTPVIASGDGRALETVIPLRSDLGQGLRPAVDALRARVQVDGLTVYATGPAASQADLAGAFSGVDGLLVGVALGVVLLILLAVYRSVLLPAVVILGAVLALGVASSVVYVLAQHGVVRVDGQVQGILSILVIGAATDYALLLSARFREELASCGDRFAAMRTALRRSVEPIVASATTVALGLLALLVSDLANNRALGPVGAIGIAAAALSALTFVPAVLVLCGGAVYWPAGLGTAPGYGTRAPGLWGRVARVIARRPRRVWTACLGLLVVAACFAPQFSAAGVPLKEIFTGTAPSVAGQDALDAHFPGGSGDPAVIVVKAAAADAVADAARTVPGVAAVTPVTASGSPAGPPLVREGRVLLDAVLTAPADGDAARTTVVRLRAAVHRIPEADALVGGYTAQQYDTQVTARRDREVIIPVVLAIITLVLVLLLRSLVAPLLLVATVVLNYLATLGVGAIVLPRVFGLHGADASVPLYGFVFLVALGVDYNIFLMTRVREEATRYGTREGVLRGLTSTGGVITSAGVVLAATFAALGVIPLAFLLQIAFIVAFGVLTDTVVVRSLLVPALVRDAGATVWWPGRPDPREGPHPGPARRGAETEVGENGHPCTVRDPRGS